MNTLKEVVLGPMHVDYCGVCHGIFLDPASSMRPC